jgi:hypothetical protein
MEPLQRQAEHCALAICIPVHLCSHLIAHCDTIMLPLLNCCVLNADSHAHVRNLLNIIYTITLSGAPDAVRTLHKSCPLLQRTWLSGTGVWLCVQRCHRQGPSRASQPLSTVRCPVWLPWQTQSGLQCQLEVKVVLKSAGPSRSCVGLSGLMVLTQ